MKKCKILNLFSLLLCALSIPFQVQAVRISVTNPLPFLRTEMVEASASEFPKKNFVITDEYGIEVPWQRTYDGKVIFPASVGAESTVVFTVAEGKPGAVEKRTFAAFYPERIDDIAWENDFSAYRAYGPASKGEMSGYDVFTKSTTRPVVPERYFNELVRKVSYHIDHGDGMDQYDVGPTLGAGASAPVGKDGKLILPGAFSEYKILDNGPLRTTLELTFEYGGGKDVRTITLDAGTPFNKVVSRLEGFDVDSIATGVVVHKPATQDYVLGKGYVAYSDPTSTPGKTNGRIFVGALSAENGSSKYQPLEKEWKSAVGHALLTQPVKKGKVFTYYWGSTWSKGRIMTFNQWVNEMTQFQKELKAPLEIKRLRD